MNKDKKIYFFIITVQADDIFAALSNALIVINVWLSTLEIGNFQSTCSTDHTDMNAKDTMHSQPIGNYQQKPMLYLHGNLLV